MCPFVSIFLYVFRVHPCCGMKSHFIIFYCQRTFHCMDMPHCVYPSIRWWTPWLFPLLVVWWTTLLWAATYQLLCGPMFSFLLNLPTRTDLLDHAAALYLTFGELPDYFIHWVILHSYQQRMRALVHHKPCLLIICLYYGHPSGCRVVSHCGFELGPTMADEVEPLFLCLLVICILSLEKYLFTSLPLFLKKCGEGSCLFYCITSTTAESFQFWWIPISLCFLLLLVLISWYSGHPV